ncbi:hypothetical protein ONZ43_g419 [Nemania bipapillata]|uniref:Uncharacterized protein n=1 Tax=Nemania bipapillata TaxID=110536 RepID=A0ACC2J938_9PEZI|nr:hypothetical protein ONZ43_g419 [Nemania bipapillata]
MSERKVLTKYYPADCELLLLAARCGRLKSKPSCVRKPKATGPKVQTVRLMAPFSMKCLKCGEYIYRGRKFKICFRTDPKHNDYACERGAKRNTEPWRVGREETDEERLDRLEKEEEERDAMVELEAKTVDAKREMAVADALDEIRTRNARVERADRDGLEATVASVVDQEAELQEREDAEAARRAFESARRLDDMIAEEIIEDCEISSTISSRIPSEANGTTLKPETVPHSSSSTKSSISTDMPPPSFKRIVKKKKDHAALLGIKKKPSLV